MQSIPPHVQQQFRQILTGKNISQTMHSHSLKWLRYYLDFCHKYGHPHEQTDSLPCFLKKLQEKRQTQAQQAQATQAISLYYEVLAADSGESPFEQPGQHGETPHPSGVREQSITSPSPPEHAQQPHQRMPPDTRHEAAPSPAQKEMSHPPPRITGRGASWKAEYEGLARTLLAREYPEKTANAYTKWIRTFQAFVRSKSPAMVSSADAEAFLASRHGTGRKAFSKQRHAYDALVLFFQHVLKQELALERPLPDRQEKTTTRTGTSNIFSGRGASWEAEFTRLEAEIKTRQYSRNTLKTYRMWTSRFQAFTRSKAPQTLTVEDVKAYLTSLAVEREVSASTQNQAFNALLFFFRHVLGKEFGEIDGVVRAKYKPYIPVVLSREEIDAIVRVLDPPYDLVVKLLYGCGLRLFECLNLRVQCFNFDAGVLTVHDGKGKKDRTVPLPQTILPELRAQMEAVKTLHRQDVDKQYAGVFLVSALDKKYPSAAKQLIWQWFFPAKQLTYVHKTTEYRRYHLHTSHVQKAVKRAAEQAQICKRVTCHTFRHSFATHLLQANYDIRTIQELLGHNDVKTTMIYTHTAKNATNRKAVSPLDLERGHHNLQ